MTLQFLRLRILIKVKNHLHYITLFTLVISALALNAKGVTVNRVVLRKFIIIICDTVIILAIRNVNERTVFKIVEIFTACFNVDCSMQVLA